MTINLINYALAKKDWNKAYEDLKVLEIGGRNLIPNSDFTDGLNGWRNWGSAIERKLVSITNLPGLTNALHVINSGSGDSGLAMDNISFIKGETYTLSVWVYNNSSNPIHLQAGAGGIGWRNKLFNVPKDKWTRISFTFEALSDKFIIYFGTISGDIDALFTGVKLEKGNKATDWTPAPEDINAHPFVAELAEFVFLSKQNEERIRNLENALTALGGGS